jgi:thiol-disulfide isomerase/thioredoxin
MAIKITKKDKSLILFLAAFIVVVWFIFSFLTNLIFSSSFAASDASKITSVYKDNEKRWLNLSRPLTQEDIKDRVILLDFWTYACVNCQHMIPEVKKLEKEFGNKLMVIGVHSGKFDNEKDFESIKKAVLKGGIEHAIVNDDEFKIWNNFKIQAWPSLVLIDPKGRVKETYIGETSAEKISKDVAKLVRKYRHHLNREDLPILLEKNKIIKTVLSYPTKIIYAKDFSYKSYKGPVLFIANSGRNNILVTKLNGEVILQIGSKNVGFEDGFLEDVKFNSPSGLLYNDDKLYVADTFNHSLREINFKEKKVRTLVGSGKRGSIIPDEDIKSRSVLLSSPTDLEFFPDKNHIAIANSGTHQILSLNLKTSTVSLIAGNGLEGIYDGKFPSNSLAQTSDLSAYDGKLYFLDSETSSLRVLDKNGVVKTLIGTGLFNFGDKNGDKSQALMQHPLGLFVNNRGAYIADSFNHKIRKYNFNSKKISDLFGSARGEDLGKKMQFNEPDGIVVVNDSMYVIDSNNNRLVRVDYDKMDASLVSVMPKLQLPKEGFLQYLPNLQKMQKIAVKEKDVEIKINFEDGWKLNEKGPSFLNLLEVVAKDKANLINTFDWNMIKNGEMKLPKLKKGKKYILQGTIYFCEDKKDALCYIASHEQEIEIAKDGKETINIEL